MLITADSRAKKLRELESTEGNAKNVYVIFADRFSTEGADIKEMIDALKADNGKVLVVTSDMSRYEQVGSYFASQNLSLPAAILVGTAVLSKEKLPVPAREVSEMVARLTLGLKGRLSLGDISSLMRDAALRVSALRNPGRSAVENAVKTAMSNHDVPVALAEATNILRAPIADVQTNLNGNSQYYLQRGQGSGEVALRTRQAAEMKKATAEFMQMRKDEADRATQKAKQAKIKLDYDAYVAELNNVSNTIDIDGLINDYHRDVNKIKDDATGTLDSMVNLLNDSLCKFPAVGDVGSQDAGYLAFQRVAKGPYAENLVKNPMQLFSIKDDEVLLPNPALNSPPRVSIGLNCFLTGPGQRDANDGNFTLKKRILSIKNNLTKVTKDALNITRSMSNRNPATLGRENDRLRERMSETLAGTTTFNSNYWKKDIAIPTNSTAGVLNAPAKYGSDFDLNLYVKPYPIDHTNVAIFPVQYTPVAGGAALLLPETFFATRAPISALTNTQWNFDEFNNAGGTVGPNQWSIARLFGLAMQEGVPPLIAPIGSLHLDTALLPTAPPAWYPDLTEFRYMNSRIWTWFLSRIVGKLTTDIFTKGQGDLYVAQGVPVAVDYFANDRVFIEKLFSLTKAFVQKSNRDVIAEQAKLVIDDYRMMLGMVYDLPYADYDAFMKSGTPLAQYFIRIEKNLEWSEEY